MRNISILVEDVVLVHREKSNFEFIHRFISSRWLYNSVNKVNKSKIPAIFLFFFSRRVEEVFNALV